MLDKSNEYTYPAFLKKSYDGYILTFPDFPELSIMPSPDRWFVFAEGKRVLQHHLEELLLRGYILPEALIMVKENPELGELVFITAYCEIPGFWWRKSFMDKCISYTVFLFLFFFTFSGSSILSTIIGWASMLGMMLIVSGIISFFTNFIHHSLSWYKVSAFKRIFCIFGLCILSVCVVWVLSNNNIM